MTATEAQQLTDADLLTFAVIFEWRVRQRRHGITWLAMPLPPCPTCQADVREMVVSETPWMMGNSILLAPCQHRYKVTDDDMLRIAEHAQNMLDDIEWDGISGTPADIAAEAHARLGEAPSAPALADLREPDNPAATALAQHIADHPMSTIQAAFRILGMQMTIEARPAMPDCPACEAGIAHDEHCPTPETHNWGCGCPTGEQPATGDRSSGKPRAGEPSGTTDRP